MNLYQYLTNFEAEADLALRSARHLLLIAALGTSVTRAQDGIWTQTTTGGAWSNSSNWSAGQIASGTNATASFNQIDLTAGSSLQVLLDAPYTAGNLNFGDTDPSSSGTWELAGTGTLTLAGTSPTITTSVNTTIGSSVVLSGTAGFTKQGTGTLLLNTTSSSLSGEIYVKAGTLAIGQNGSTSAVTGSGGITLANGSTFSLASTGVNFPGNNLTLESGAHTYLSSASISNGFAGNVYGPSDATLELNSIVSFNVTGSQQFGNFNGTVKVPSGSQLRFSATTTGANGNGGANTTFDVDGIVNTRNRANAAGVAIGALTGSGQLQGQTNTAASYVLYKVGSKNIDSTFAGTFVNGANGPAYLEKVGSGKLTLTGDSPATGNVTVTTGTLALGNGGSTGSFATSALSVASGANLLLNRDGTLNLAAVISGAGRIAQQGPGTTVLSGNNTFTAGIEISGGTLQISSDGNLGGSSGGIAFTGTGTLASSASSLALSRATSIASGARGTLAVTTAGSSLTQDGIISGAGALGISGSGIISLTGANTYTGGTTINGGTLVLGSSGNATGTGNVEVSSGVIAGTGSIPAALHLASGAGIRPGSYSTSTSSVGTLTTNALTLDGGSTLYYEFGGANGNDSLATTDLTVNATSTSPVLVDLRLENTSTKWISPGTYTIVSFTNALTSGIASRFQVASSSIQSGLTYQFSVSGNQLLLTITGGSASSWKNDASGTWSATGNWVNGVPNSIGAAANLGTVITQERTVTVSATTRLGSLSLENENAYTVSGIYPLTFQTSSGSASLQLIRGSHLISTPLSLTSSVEATLVRSTDQLSLSGNISGAGSITQQGTGTLALSGSNSFTGGITLGGGTLQFQNGSLGSGALTLNAGTLRWDNNSRDITQSRTVSFGTQPVTFDLNGNEITLANAFGGDSTASLSLTGSGTLILAGDASYTGTTTINTGTLQLGSGGNSGSVAGGIINNADLVVNHGSDFNLSSLISGTGNLTQRGTGTTYLTEANTFSGGTYISAGKLAVSTSLALQNSTLNYYADGGDFSFDYLSSATLGGLNGDKPLALENDGGGAVALTLGNNGSGSYFSSTISGAGSLIKIGSGSQALAGGVNISSSVEVRNGSLQVDGGLSASSLLVSGSSTLQYLGGNGIIQGSGSINNASGGTQTLEVDGGSLQFTGALNATGNQNYPYLVKVYDGTLSAASVSLARSNLNWSTEPAAGDNARGIYQLNGQINVSGDLNIGLASGVTVNSSASVRIDGGTFNVGGITTIGQSTGSRWSALDVNGGVFNSSNTDSGLILGGPTAGNGVLLVRAGTANIERIQLGQAAVASSGIVAVSGTGVLNLGSGGVVIGSTNSSFIPLIRLGKASAIGGTLAAHADWTTSAPVQILGTSTIQAADASGTARQIELSGTVSGAGNLIKTGTGTLVLSGTITTTGSTLVQAGTLKLKSAGLPDSAALEVTSNGLLNLAFTGRDTIGSLILNGVSVTGEWGSPSSGAANTSALITGTGKLQVGASAATPFESWASSHGLTGNDALSTADPDHDGQPNLLEFALDSDPTSSSASGKVSTKVTSISGNDALIVTLPVRNGAVFSGSPAKSAVIDGALYVIEGTNDLATYDQVIEELGTAQSSGLPTLSTGWTYHSFRLSGDIATRGPRGFLRIRVEESP
jgi:fibronectin-binding autotransporter adhesin